MRPPSVATPLILTKYFLWSLFSTGVWAFFLLWCPVTQGLWSLAVPCQGVSLSFQRDFHWVFFESPEGPGHLSSLTPPPVSSLSPTDWSLCSASQLSLLLSDTYQVLYSEWGPFLLSGNTWQIVPRFLLHSCSSDPSLAAAGGLTPADNIWGPIRTLSTICIPVFYFCCPASSFSIRA